MDIGAATEWGPCRFSARHSEQHQQQNELYGKTEEVAGTVFKDFGCTPVGRRQHLCSL